MRTWGDRPHLQEFSPGLRARYLATQTLGRFRPIDDVVAARHPLHPHLLTIWEPLETKAPSPARCLPYCCYRATVIFYHRPYITQRSGHLWRSNGRWHWQPGDKGFEIYDQVESRLTSDDVISFDDEDWLVQSGHVRWHRGRWWMRWNARRSPSLRQAV